ncbi:MAG: hypothetical protein ACKOBN_03960 [Flavobacteriales bacterium]
MTDFQELTEAPKRPVFLLVLVILSSINIGISTIGSLTAVLGAKPDADMVKKALLDYAEMREQLEQAGASDYTYIVDQMQTVTTQMFANFHLYNSIQLIFLLLGLTGVILMFKGKRLGFHFYIIYSIGLVLMPFFFNAIQQIPTVLTVVGILYGAVWVFLYARNLHWINE